MTDHMTEGQTHMHIVGVANLSSDVNCGQEICSGGDVGLLLAL